MHHVERRAPIGEACGVRRHRAIPIGFDVVVVVICQHDRCVGQDCDLALRVAKCTAEVSPRQSTAARAPVAEQCRTTHGIEQCVSGDLLARLRGRDGVEVRS